MEMEKMIELIDAVSKSDLTGFKYEEDGIKLHLSKKENTCYVTENVSAPVNMTGTASAATVSAGVVSAEMEKTNAEGDQTLGAAAEEAGAEGSSAEEAAGAEVLSGAEPSVVLLLSTVPLVETEPLSLPLLFLLSQEASIADAEISAAAIRTAMSFFILDSNLSGYVIIRRSGFSGEQNDITLLLSVSKLQDKKMC